MWALEADGKIHRRIRRKNRIDHETAEPQFHLTTKALQRALKPLAGEDTPIRADGTLSLEAEYWAPKIPGTDVGLAAWASHGKLQKVLSTYLSVYSRADRVFPKLWTLGARTGRMSASCPSVQNVPKRKYGIRALFVPAPGLVFTKADYTAQELYTLCEAMIDRGIKGPLYEAIVSGVDLHKYTAALVLRKPIEEVTKDDRQAQKACNFGIPGGLGPQKLADYAFGLYGLTWTKEEAAVRRQSFLDVFTDIEAYLQSMKKSQDFLLRKVSGLGRRDWAEALEVDDWNIIRSMTLNANPEIAAMGQEAERQLTIELPTGFRRSNCRFTEGANCAFQGLAAAVTKAAAWRAFRAGLQIVLCVHDELVCERRPEDTAVPKVLEDCMLAAFREVCPHVGQFARVEVEDNLRRWGPPTDGKGRVIEGL